MAEPGFRQKRPSMEKFTTGSGTCPPVESSLVSEDERVFAQVAEMIQAAQVRAVVSVTAILTEVYWKVGEVISSRIATQGWGRGTVTALSAYVQARHPAARGFSPQNLWRMRQFSRFTSTSQISQHC
jgi:hypothetical protein